MTLVENIQREDLNAIEQARAFERLMDEFHATQEAVAERTGKDRTTVANAIRLLKLEPTIQDWIEEGKLTAGHGRALLAVPDSQMRMRYAQRAARGGLTVRQIERLASRRSRGAKTLDGNSGGSKHSRSARRIAASSWERKCFCGRKPKCDRDSSFWNTTTTRS